MAEIERDVEAFNKNIARVINVNAFSQTEIGRRAENGMSLCVLCWVTIIEQKEIRI